MTIKLIPQSLRDRLFSKEFPLSLEAKFHASTKDVEDDSTMPSNVDFSLLDDEPIEDASSWFKRASDELYEPWGDKVDSLIKAISSPKFVAPPIPPKIWHRWLRYDGNEWQAIESEELPDAICLDFETINVGGVGKKKRWVGGIWYPILCTAYGDDECWYCWQVKPYSPPTYLTIPFRKNCLVVAYNGIYDWKYLDTENDILPSGNKMLDLMSVAMRFYSKTSTQRAIIATIDKVNKEQGKDIPYPSWERHVSDMSLSAVYYHIFKIPISKEIRDETLVKCEWFEWCDRRVSIVQYGFEDIIHTCQILPHLWSKFTLYAPHNASKYGLISRTLFTPFSKEWYKYIDNVDTVYDNTIKETHKILKDLAREVRTLGYARVIQLAETDPTYKPLAYDLDWSKLKSGKNKGRYRWFAEVLSKGVKLGSRLAVYLLRLRFDGEPLRYDHHPLTSSPEKPQYTWVAGDKALPHKEGELSNLATPLVTYYDKYVEKGRLTTDTDVDLAYLYKLFYRRTQWQSYRERTHSLHLVDRGEYFSCIPQAVPYGTQTGRMRDSFFLVYPKANKEKIGSEVLGLIEAPKGYRIFYTDFDAQESGIAATLGDSIARYPGSCPWSISVLVGDKDKGTSVHNLMQDLCGGIDYTMAKNNNFAIQYGCGLDTLVKMILIASIMTELEASKIAKNAIDGTRGVKQSNGYYSGGTASCVFNYLKSRSQQTDLRTPVLGIQIPDSINPKNVGKEFVTTRQNWVIQGSGSDMLDMMITGIEYYCQKYSVPFRFMLAKHDGLYYLVDENHIALFNSIVQLVHLKVKVHFYQNNGINHIPIKTAFFAETEYFNIFTSGKNLQGVTPSNKEGFNLEQYEIEDVENIFSGLDIDSELLYWN